MRIVVLGLLSGSLLVAPVDAAAQSASGGGQSGASAQGTEVALGPHVVRREHSSDAHVGGGITAARRWGRAAGVIEAGGTRREGHNDWRLLAGARGTLAEGSRTRLFAHGLAGVAIRSGTAGLALLPGLGVDVQTSDAQALRLQVDVPVERSSGRMVAGVRASVWLVFTPRRR